MFKNRYLMALVASFSIISAVPAASQEGTTERPVILGSTVQLVVPADPAGEAGERLEAAKNVLPQDQLLFAVTYHNEGPDAVTDLLIVNPVPASVRLAEQSAQAEEVSVDGGTVWGRLSDLTVPGSDGEPVPASIDNVSHLRWRISRIAPGEHGQVNFRAFVR